MKNEAVNINNGGFEVDDGNEKMEGLIIDDGNEKMSSVEMNWC